ncbi:MAG: pyrroloquinoline quinone biosynthesis protein PqqB [Gammaproteobacteria bacterium]|nr:pyrroloquinoline quinone biosynthesis protein PqqB [Gammaproteobacteria bacterium]
MQRRAAILLLFGVCAAFSNIGCAYSPLPTPFQPNSNAPFLLVLGIAQDGGVPQTGSGPAAGIGGGAGHQDLIFQRLRAPEPAFRRLVVSLAVVDPQSRERWLFEATPDIKEQLFRLDIWAPVPGPAPRLNGIFLTHAHMGHYTGLAQFGHEALGAKDLPVYAMPRMASFLSSSGPWDQLVRLGNIKLKLLDDGKPVQLNQRLSVTPLRVPHRQEYSEVVGFIIEGPEKRVLFIPDIDSWEELDAQGTRIEDLIASVDVAYLDATFYADGEIPGRDMSGFPHPFITNSMRRFAKLPMSERAKVRFIHLNHTNPALLPGSKARQAIERAGLKVAEEMERVEL